MITFLVCYVFWVAIGLRMSIYFWRKDFYDKPFKLFDLFKCIVISFSFGPTIYLLVRSNKVKEKLSNLNITLLSPKNNE